MAIYELLCIMLIINEVIARSLSPMHFAIGRILMKQILISPYKILTPFAWAANVVEMSSSPECRRVREIDAINN